MKINIQIIKAIKLNLNLLLILIFSFSILSCMGSKSSFQASNEDTQTNSGSTINPNPTSDADVKKNSDSLKTFLVEVFEFLTTGLYELQRPNKPIEEKEELLKEFQARIQGSNQEYEAFVNSTKIYKALKEEQKESLKCGTDDQKLEDQEECESIEDSIEKAQTQIDAAESYVGCYLDQFEKFDTAITATLRGNLTSATLGPLFLSLIYAEFKISDLSNLTDSCDTSDGDE